MSTASGSEETDAWIRQFPPKTQKLLRQIRTTVTRAVPEAEEVFRYGIPTLRLKKNLLHYAAFEHHIGLYPTPSAMQHFADQLKGYQQGKGSVQFPLDEPLPLALIADIARFRAAEEAAAGKKTVPRAVKSGNRKQNRPAADD
ncbi:MAG: iron chaperone [Planctomycetota bacterium]